MVYLSFKGNCVCFIDDFSRANQRWIDTLDLGPNAINDWGNKIHPDDRERAVNAYLEAITTRQGYAQPIEMRLVDGDRLMDVSCSTPFLY